METSLLHWYTVVTASALVGRLLAAAAWVLLKPPLVRLLDRLIR